MTCVPDKGCNRNRLEDIGQIANVVLVEVRNNKFLYSSTASLLKKGGGAEARFIVLSAIEKHNIVCVGDKICTESVSNIENGKIHFSTFEESFAVRLFSMPQVACAMSSILVMNLSTFNPATKARA